MPCGRTRTPGPLTAVLRATHTAGHRAEHLGSSPRSAAGIWTVGDGQSLAEATAASLEADGPHATADFLVNELRGMDDRRSDGPRSVHPQLRQAIEVVSSRLPDHVDVASVAGAVALSPDYLGRLCKQQTGVSFSATIRWERLVTAVSHILDGRSVTDAAHLAGFADGSHATKVCWEMTGATPRELAAIGSRNTGSDGSIQALPGGVGSRLVACL